MKLLKMVVAAAIAAAPAGVLAQAPPATTPATAAALPEGPLKIEVVSVAGTVRATPPGGAAVKAAPGQQYDEGVKFFIMPKSKIVLRIQPDQLFEIDRQTRIQIVRSAFRNGRLYTDTGLEFGRVQYQIQAAGFEHESTITTPNAALAVRGTTVIMYDQPPFAPTGISLTGRARFRDARKTVSLGRTNGHTTSVNTLQPTPAEAALADAVVDPSIARARTATETQLIQQLIARGSQTFFDPVRGIETIRGGTPPDPMAFAGKLPGLNIVLTWHEAADLDIGVTRPQASGINTTGPAEFLYPIRGLDRYPNGDTVPFNHLGGPKGGIEIVEIPGIHDSETLSEILNIGAVHVSGKPATLHLNAFLDGRPQQFVDLLNNETLTNEFVDTIDQKQNSSIALLPLGQATTIFLNGAGGGGLGGLGGQLFAVPNRTARHGQPAARAQMPPPARLPSERLLPGLHGRQIQERH